MTCSLKNWYSCPWKALGPSTALSVLNPRSTLNPGTILLTYMEIVSKLKVDLKNQIFYSVCNLNTKEHKSKSAAITQNCKQGSKLSGVLD